MVPDPAIAGDESMKNGLKAKTEQIAVGELASYLDSIDSRRLLDDISSLVESSRRRVALSVNSERVMLYWHIGRRIIEDLPAENRAEYRARIIGLVSERLTAEYGKGFRCSHVFHMIRFAEIFDDLKIVQTLSGHIELHETIRLARR